MRNEPTRAVLADTGFWIAVYDQRDAHHAAANSIMDSMTGGTFLFPWPLYYEVLRTRFVGRPGWVEGFLRVRKAGRLYVLDDCKYRDRALETTLDLARSGRRLSLVDVIIRLVLDDRQLRIRELITFNVGDFRDVCTRRSVAIRSE